MPDQRAEQVRVRLHRIGPGHYRTHDGRYNIGRMDADGIWQVWTDDDEYPTFGQGFATLRDARQAIAAAAAS